MTSLNKYTKLIINNGINIQPDQTLVIRSQISTADFAKKSVWLKHMKLVLVMFSSTGLMMSVSGFDTLTPSLIGSRRQKNGTKLITMTCPKKTLPS